MLSLKKQKTMDNSAKLIVKNNPNTNVSEQFRTIRTNIQYSMVDQQIKTIVITSARQESGKSFTAANLAATLASEDKRILLVDADLRRPTVHRIFRLKNHIGLTTLLTDKSLSTEKIIQYSRIKNLYILPSGAIPPNPSELLNTNRMTNIMKKLEEDFDLIIYDLPPVLAVTDAQIMAGKVDGTIFILPKGKVTEEDALKSKELLSLVGANILGAVFNRVEKSKSAYYYSQTCNNK